MGLIAFQLFRPNENDFPHLELESQKQTIQPQNQLDVIFHEMQALYMQTQLEKTFKVIPLFVSKASPFTKKIATKNIVRIGSWHHLFSHPNFSNLILQFLNIQQWQTIKKCCKGVKSIVMAKLLRNQNNWNLTMGILSPLILKETHLKQSGLDDDYQHSEDLDRTSGYFENQNSQDVLDHQVMLDKIITTISFKIKYFQGIMPICASLLQCFNQNISYWLLRYILFKCHYIQNDIKFYHSFIQELENEFKVVLPQVYDHLDYCGFELNYFVMKWIMGLFSEDMSKTMVLAVWDLLCLTDVTIMIYVILGIFKCFSDQILASNSDEINNLLKADLKCKLSMLKCQELIGIIKELYIERKLQIHFHL